MRIVQTLIVAAALGTAPAAMAQAQVSQEQVSQEQADSERLAVVERHIDAYRTGNIDRFVATFADDAEVYALGMEARGHEEIKAIYVLNFGKDAPKIRVDEIEVMGGMVYVTAAYIFPNGEEMCCSLSEYEVIDGKIAYLSASG